MEDLQKFINFLPMLIQLGLDVLKKQAEAKGMTLDDALDQAAANWNQAGVESTDLLNKP